MKVKEREYFPDGTPIDQWFYEHDLVKVGTLGKRYVLTEYGVLPNGEICTEKIQKIIDIAA